MCVLHTYLYMTCIRFLYRTVHIRGPESGGEGRGGKVAFQAPLSSATGIAAALKIIITIGNLITILRSLTDRQAFTGSQ